MECHVKNHHLPILELGGIQFAKALFRNCCPLEVSRVRPLKENSYSVIPFAALLALADAVVVVLVLAWCAARSR